MRTWIVLILLMLAVSACNLNQAGEVTPQPDLSSTPIPSAFRTATPLGPTSLPALPTRTPAGGPLTTPSDNLYATLQAVPTSATGEQATIDSPAAGGTVYTGTVRISGGVENLSQDAFTLSILTPTGDVVNTQPINLMNPNHVAKVPWSAAMTITSYTGNAIIEVRARSATDEDIVLARTPITIQRAGSGSTGGNVVATGLPSNASGPVGSIDTPTANEGIGGDPIQVTGTAGGILTNSFTLALIAPDGNVLNSQTISLTSAETNVVPWAAALGTSGYKGIAELRATAGTTVIASIPITLR